MAIKIPDNFNNIEEVATYLRELNKKKILIFAHNGTGKTRLSMIFKEFGKNRDEGIGDTLYYNAFTEDLFFWDNDLDHDEERILKFNTNSHFFDGLKELEIANRIRPILNGYADFDFTIDHERGEITFNRQEMVGDTIQKIDNIKVSRGEENIFIWCFFLTIAQLAIEGQEAYSWVKNIYIDDPISSLDDNNAIAVACHLGKLLNQDTKIKTIISTHHGLFFNAIHNILNNNAPKFYLCKKKDLDTYKLKDIKDTPFFHHIVLFAELKKAIDSDKLYTYHFNMLRNLLEKTAAFHGFDKFSDCMRKWEDDPDEIIYNRVINIMSHGNYSLFDMTELSDDNKRYIKKIFKDLGDSYRFNEKIINDL